MKADRWFYSTAAVFFLVTMLVGFRHFANGAASDGSPLDPSMFRLDLVHGTAIAAWYVLFFVQSLLISVRSRRLHFKLGWSAVAVAFAISVTGPIGRNSLRAKSAAGLPVLRHAIFPYL